MIAMTTPVSQMRAFRKSPVAIPDRMIGLYFAGFPIIVALFLSLQAVRVHATDMQTVPAYQTVQAVGP